MKRVFICFLTLVLCFCTISLSGVFANEENNINTVFLDYTKTYNAKISGVSLFSAEKGSDWITVSAETLSELLDSGMVEYYEEDYPVDIHSYSENDPCYYISWEHPMIKSEMAWERGALGENVRVAVIDSGCNDRDETAGRIVAKRSYFSDGNYDDVSDNMNHGTIVTDIIASNRGDGLSSTGVAPRSDIVILKVIRYKTDSNGNVMKDNSGEPLKEGKVSQVSQAIRDAVDLYNCDIINISLGATEDTTMMKEAVNHAISKGAIIVASSGNDGNSTENYPASYSNVISVGAVDIDGKIADFSQKNNNVDISAPGMDVRVLLQKVDNGVSGYEASGTSFASPYVAGICAALLSADASLEPSEIENIIKSTVTKTGEEETEVAYGAGIVNFGDALKKVIENSGIYISAVDIEDSSNPVFITNTDKVDGQYKLYFENLNGNMSDCTLTLKKGEPTRVSLKNLAASVSSDLFVTYSDNDPYCISTRATDGLLYNGADAIEDFSIEVCENEAGKITLDFVSPIYKAGQKCNMTVSLNDETVYFGELSDGEKNITLQIEHGLNSSDHICADHGDKFEVTLWGEDEYETEWYRASSLGRVDERGHVIVDVQDSQIKFDNLFRLFTGKLFKGWRDKTGNYINLAETQTVIAGKGDEFTPVYRDYTDEGEDADVKASGEEIRVQNGDTLKKDLRVLSRMKKDFLSDETVGIVNFGGENVRYGHIVIPFEDKYVSEGESIEKDKETSKGHVPKVSAAVKTYNEDDEYVEFSVCITGIRNPSRQYVVRPYISYTDNNGVERIIYGKQRVTKSLDELK